MAGAVGFPDLGGGGGMSGLYFRPSMGPRGLGGAL